MFFNDRETIIRLTPEWTGERLPDGRRVDRFGAHAPARQRLGTAAALEASVRAIRDGDAARRELLGHGPSALVSALYS